MTEARAGQVYDLFQMLVDLPKDEQAAFLERKCAGNLELLTELQALLAADERVGALTARPMVSELASVLMNSAQETTFERARIGAFEVREKIGHGGMGVVYRAERVDGTVEQQVAIKFVRRELLSDEVRSRFLLERRALASMNHPNIARLIDAAELEDGTPYFIMEYVQGVSLTEYVKQHSLSIPDRIRLFRTVCEAVAHAHRSLIVHRDLKPGNILVTSDGTPKLLDFGIAKTLNADEAISERTGTQHRYFSPRYAAPEQILGEPIGVGCDVYALGLLLCECLADAPAFDFTDLSPAQIERLVTAVPPSAPSQIASKRGAPVSTQRQLRGDLDGVVLQCLRKSPTERYASVDLLCLELSAYLQGRPVSARGGHAWYRARKFVVRNAIPVALGSLALSALVGGIVAFAIQGSIAEQRAAELEQVAAFQAEMLTKLDPSEAGRLLSESVISSHTNAFDSGTLADGVSDRQRAFADEWNQLNATDLARELVDNTIIKPAVISISEQFEEQPLVAAQLYRALARTYLRIGPEEEASKLLKRSLELQQSELGPAHPQTLETHYLLGNAKFNQRKYQEAADVYTTVLAEQRTSIGDNHEQTIQTMSDLGSALGWLGEHDSANLLTDEALERAQRAFGIDDERTLYVLEGVANNFLVQSRHREAEVHLRRILSSRMESLGVDSERTQVVLGNLVYSLVEQGRSADALPFSLQRVESALRVQGIEHSFTSSALLNHGMLLQRLERFDESEKYLSQALESRISVFGPDRVQTLWIYNRLGETQQLMGKLVEARSNFEFAHTTSLRILGAEHEETLVSAQNLASLELDVGHVEKALAVLEPIEAASRAVFGEGRRTGKRTARLLMYLGSAQRQSGQFARSERSLLDAHRIFNQVVDMELLENRCRTEINQLYEARIGVEPSGEFEQRASEWLSSFNQGTAKVSTAD